MCREWRSSDPGCPRIAPLAGTVCDTPDLFCTYDDRCGVSLGDDLKCTDGFWHRFVSAAGSCIIHACRKTPVDAGADHPPDTCAQASDCPGGTCWQQLDGARACVKPVPARPLTLCPGGNAICCLADADCTGGMNGRCLSLRDAEGDFCGRPIPTGNTCKYEECRTDADCGTHLPSAGPIVACLPSGAFGLLHATCVAGACRTDADCGLHPGGKCRFPLAAARGECGSATALFCAYPNDPCQVDDNTATPCPQGQLCAPADDLQGQVCRLPRTPA